MLNERSIHLGLLRNEVSVKWCPEMTDFQLYENIITHSHSFPHLFLLLLLGGGGSGEVRGQYSSIAQSDVPGQAGKLAERQNTSNCFPPSALYNASTHSPPTHPPPSIFLIIFLLPMTPPPTHTQPFPRRQRETEGGTGRRERGGRKKKKQKNLPKYSLS